MFRTWILLVAVALVATSRANAEDDTPQKMQIGRGGALVRCGPGASFYVTSRLAEGEEIEVWQSQDDGWLAIRPPESSFSLVPARDVRRIPHSEMATVTGKDTVAWVGTSLGNRGDYKWQVRLKEGETIEVIGDAQLALHKDKETELLVRIAPPAGEFRWVRLRDTTEGQEPATEELAEKTPAEPAPAAQAPIADAKQAGQAEQRIAVVDYQAKPKTGVDLKPDAQQGDGFIARKSTNPQEKPAGTDASSGRWTATGRKTTATSGPFDAALRDAELRLSLMAAQPASQWDFESLRAEAQELLHRGTNTLERARAQRFSDQVEEFHALKQRFAVLGTDGPEGLATGVVTADDGAPAVDPRFDGTGWLLPVHSSQRTAPPYALLDSEGRILQFVSPAPGLNLHRYLRKEIGIYGERSFATALEKPHVTAHRVVELDRHRR